jgi:small-conductance mechanosensitive channel/CRP-like cAMP-binding protein
MGTQVPAYTSLLDQEALLQAVTFVVAALAALAFAKKERRHTTALISFYVLSIALRGLEVLFRSLAMPGIANTMHFLALLLQGIAILNLCAVFFFEILLRGVRLEAPRILKQLARAMLAIGLMLYLFSQYHVDVSGIVATSAVITAVVGFSLQDTLINVMGGIALQLDRSIEPGDWVQFGEHSGKVQEISWRSISLLKRNGDTVIIPNGLFMKNHAILRGKQPDGSMKERRWIYFNVDLRSTPAAVIEAVDTALTREPMPSVSETPAPRTLVTDFKDSWIQYGVQYWLSDIAQDDPADSTVRTRIFYGLRRAGIQPSIPAATIFTEASDDMERRQRHTDRDKATRLRALDSVTIFQSLTPEEKEYLAEVLIYAPFFAGEAMVVQGRAVHHLYIMTRGEADVRVTVEGAAPRIITRITAPDFFGEMGMLTGEPRRATVIAVAEVDCWRLEKERFQQVLTSRPELASEISAVLATRQVNLGSATEGLSEEAKRRRIDAEHGTLTTKIRNFFGLG